jgi:cytoskeletal protein CcmA (bactofilin family)
MGATYTRQSSYTDGDVITAAHTNDEFNQLLAAFQASSGHTHDGTANEGGPITKMLGTALTLGDGTAGTDITVTFDGESNDGVLAWMEDEDYFKFSDDILINGTEKLYFQDTGTHIFSNADGDLDIVSDGTNVDAIKLASSGGITLDAAGDIVLDADGDDITLKNGSATFASFTNSSGELVIKSGSTPTTAITFSGANVTFAGTVTIGSAEISEAELEILDGANVTTTELNILDGDTSASSTTVADADRVVFNDAGTMKQVAVTDLAAYFDDEITAMPNLVTTAATTVGALNSGSITSGFGTIDTGSSTITTTGLITGGSLDIDDVVINGTTIGHTNDTDLMTVADGVLTVAGEVDATSLDISGNADIDGTLETDALSINGTTVTSTATELNILDGDTSATSTTVADADRVVLNDGGTMKQVAVTDLSAYFDDEITAMPNLVTTGTLNSGAISSGFGNIDIGSSNLTATGTISLGATSFNDNAITNVGDIALDSISADGTDINVAVSDNSGTAFTIKQGSDAYLIVDTGNSSESVSIGTGVSGTAITLGHSTSEVTVADNLTVTGNLTVSGTTTTVNSTTVNLNDHNIVLDSGNSTSAVINGAGITIEGGSGDDATFTYNTTGPQFELKLGSSFEDLQTAKLTATELDISGDADIDGTLEADAITVNGTALNTVIAGVTVANATTAAVATTVTISDNESTNEDNAIIFTSGGDVDGGNIGLESDGDLTYNPSTGRLTATQLAGTLQTAAQANVTSLGTLTTLTVDNVIINGSTIGHTGDTDLMTVASGVLTVAGEVDATSLDISGDADIDGTLEADAITVNGTALNTVIADEATALAIALG